MSKCPTSIKYVSRKVSKIRWVPTVRPQFVIGSWDDRDNIVALYSLPKSDMLMSSFEDTSTNPLPNPDPQLLHKISVNNDVTEMQFIDEETFVVSTASGSVYLMRCENQHLSESYLWKRLHSIGSCALPCTSVCADVNHRFVSVGEDGTLNLVDLHTGQIIRKLEAVNEGSPTCAVFVTEQQVAVSNRKGTVTMYDLQRPGENETVQYGVPNEDLTPLTSLCVNPEVPFVLAAGGLDGTLFIYDLRSQSEAADALMTEDQSLTEVKFNPSDSSHLFASTYNGLLWFDISEAWNEARENVGIGIERGVGDASKVETAWLARAALNLPFKSYSVLPETTLPVNSLDIKDNMLICGSDNESVYLLPRLL